MTARRILLTAIAVFPLLAAGCAARSSSAASGPSSSPASASPTASLTPPQVWLAILRVAQDPNDLDADTQALKPVLGDAMQVVPASCFSGLPDRFSGERYVLGIVTDSKSQTDAVLAASKLSALFEAPVEEACAV